MGSNITNPGQFILVIALLASATAMASCRRAISRREVLAMRGLGKACQFPALSAIKTVDDICNRRLPGGTTGVETTCDKDRRITRLSFFYTLQCEFKDLTPFLMKLARLHQLSLFRCGVRGPLDPDWGRLSALRVLSILDSDVSGPLPDKFGLLKNLVSLTIAGTKCCMGQLTGSLPRSLGNLKKLQHLNLNYVCIESDLPKEWAHMANLKSLQMSMTFGLHGTLPPQWSRLETLEQLSMSHNSLQGSIPEEFENLDNLKTLDLSNNPHLCGDHEGFDLLLKGSRSLLTTSLGLACPAQFVRPESDDDDDDDDGGDDAEDEDYRDGGGDEYEAEDDEGGHRSSSQKED